MKLDVVFAPWVIKVNVSIDSTSIPALLAGMEQRLGDKIMATAQELQDQYDQLRAAVAAEVQQLADALATAGGNQAAIDTVTAGMRDLTEKLNSDDPIPPVV